MLHFLLLSWLLLMPNSNTSFATATDIGTLSGTTPFTTTQNAYNGAGVDDLYFSYLPVDGDDVLEIFGAGDVANARFAVTVWYGPAATPTQIGISANNCPMQQDIVTGVTTGQRIFIKCHDISAAHNPATLNLRVARGAHQAIVPGDLFINDSSPGYPGIAMDPTTAIPKRYVVGFAAGEGLEVLTNGVIAAQDDANGVYKIYTSALALLTTVTNPFSPLGGAFDALASNQIDTFWGADNGGGATHGKMFGFNASGTVTFTTLDVGSAGLLTLAPNSGNTKVYFAKNLSNANQALFVITVPGGVVSTFLAGVGGKFFGANVLMLSDNTLLVPYEAVGVDTVILRYNESGTLLNTYTLSAGTAPVGGVAVQNMLERIFGASSDPTEFCIWYQDSTKNYFERVNVATGARTLMGARIKFIEGVSQEGAVASTTIYSGSDFSCVPIVLRTLGGGTGGADCLNAPPLMACWTGGGIPPILGSLGCIDGFTGPVPVEMWGQ